MTWYIARVRSNAEGALARDLDEETYFPRCTRKVRIRGRKSKRVVAAWPGYLLIRNPGVIDDPRLYRFLMIDDERASLTDEQVDGFRLMERLGAFQTHAESERLLGIGEAVKVATGLLKGFGGYVHAVWGDRATLSGGDFRAPVTVPIALLSPEKSVQ